MKLSTRLFGQTYQFRDVKDVLAKANELRSGDVLAGIAAETAQERVAAKHVLSELTVADLRNNPVIPYEEDVVTRVIQDGINEGAYDKLKNWTISELREYLFCDGTRLEDIEFLRKGLTSEVVAGVAKISSQQLTLVRTDTSGNTSTAWRTRSPSTRCAELGLTAPQK